MRHDAIAKETKTSRYFFIDEADYENKIELPSYAKDSINNNKDNLTSHSKLFYSNVHQLAVAVTCIHKKNQSSCPHRSI